MKNQITLKKREEQRLLSGHQWVFSNEIQSIQGNPEAGDIIDLLRHDGKFLGRGLYNPHSLIAVRLLTRNKEEISFAFFERRISQALKLRQIVFPQAETFRLVHGEGDFLPGLIIDKYNEFLSIQTLSFGMDRRLTLICDVLESMLHPKAIVERNESHLRALEHLDSRKGVLRGTSDHTIVTENGIKFNLDLLGGQKTGLFLDQRENRKAIRRYVSGRSVLDCFCNEGGFSLNAAAGGATRVEAYDVSEAAISRARVNATINQAACISFGVSDAFDLLQKKVENGETYDVVVLDPPSFTRSRKNVNSALKVYKEINGNALKLLTNGGFLATASCSHHISEESFLGTVESAAHHAGRTVRLVHAAGAGPDHPTLPSMPETRYLKFAVFAVD
ncbi:MAG: class I SAM-dependent rRNA methyltransferase [Ignavibacteriales bacterium]|nr:class I SAM-dependent rRNA methyltransferase [Ignavibacteriales bacterium]